MITLFFASTYTTATYIPEAIERGIREPFCQNSGIISIEFCGEIITVCNGILLSPTHVLTTKHEWDLAPETGQSVVFLSHYNACHPSRQRNLTEISQKSAKVIASEDHPDADLRILKLSKALPYSNMPLLTSPPPLSYNTNAFIISYGKIDTLDNSSVEPIESIAFEPQDYIRHIGIIPLTEIKSCQIQIQDLPQLSMDYLISPINTSTPHPRLHVRTKPSDSGAAIVIQQNNQKILAGLHKGKAMSPGRESPDQLLIVPLYPHLEWIRHALEM